MTEVLPCPACGVLMNAPEGYYEPMWDLYYRRKDGRQNIEPLVYTQEDVEDDPEWYNDRENSGPWLAMGHNMAQRGLCGECGMPDLRGLTTEDFHSHEDIKELQDMWAEEAAERRAGC
jgi:hypothetical protein